MKLFNLFLFLLVLWSCQGGPDKSTPASYDLSDPDKANRIVLRVEGSFYSNSDFERYLQLVAGAEYKTLLPPSLSRLFEGFVEEKILLEAARDNQVTLTEDEQKSYLSKLSNETWTDGSKFSLNEVQTKVVHERLLIDKYTYLLIKDVGVEKAEVQAYYDLHKKDFLRPERVKVSQILLETEDKAIEVYEEVKDVSEEVFRQTAEAVSSGVEAAKGGEMGVFEMGQLPTEMENMVFSLKEGEVSPVVESQYGYHIFRLDKKFEPKLVPFEEALPEIRMKILDQKIKQVIAQNMETLKEKLDWTAYPENLNFPFQRNSDD